MAIMSFNPTYAITSIENLLRLCDEIWHQAGCTSTDVTFLKYLISWTRINDNFI